MIIIVGIIISIIIKEWYQYLSYFEIALYLWNIQNFMLLFIFCLVMVRIYKIKNRNNDFLFVNFQNIENYLYTISSQKSDT